MTATIRVKDDVQQMLDRLKRAIDAKSYDEVLRYLFKKAKRMDLSHFGSLLKLELFRRDGIDRLD